MSDPTGPEGLPELGAVDHGASRSAAPAAAPPWQRRLLVGVLVGLVAAAATWPIAPSPPALGATTTGDAALAEQVRDLLDDADGAGMGGLAVALVADGTTTTAALGHADRAGEQPLTPDTPMEIGSTTKPLTGMLLADLAEDGVVALDQSPAALLGTEDSGLAATTLEALSTHTSGLPREATERGSGPVRFVLGAGNLHDGYDATTIVEAASGHDLDGEHDAAYSNLAVALLGQALADATDTPYPELLDARILSPLGMDATTVATTPDAVPAEAATGWSANGVRPAPWIGEGLAPAGVGPWSTVEDLSVLLEAVLAGDAPGIEALAPRAAFAEDMRIGLGWLQATDDAGRQVLMHDGGTGGFLTFVGASPEAQRGVAMIASTDFLMSPHTLVPIGRALLADADAPDDPPVPPLDVPAAAVAALVTLGLAAWTVRLAIRRRRRRRPMDRLDVLGLLVPVGIGLAVLRTLGAWQVLPGPWWSAAVAVTVGAIAACAVGWRDLPTASGRRPWLRWVSAAVRGLIVALVALALL